MKRAFFPNKDALNSASNLLPPSKQAGTSKQTSQIKPGGGLSANHPSSLSDKYSFSPSPATWGTPLLLETPEADDYLHNPDPRRDRKNDIGGNIFTARGLSNLGCLTILSFGCLALFAGYPLYSHFTARKLSNQGGFNAGGINGTGQIPAFTGNFGLIDKHTPKDLLQKKSYMDGSKLTLVFSDEFNQDGRTFYPGDDPFWEAVDLQYWGTDDLEWYDPQQATTKNGYLQLTIEKVTDAINNHNLTYKSGMIQSWNKFCFTGGLIEASIRLPGSSAVSGLWPAVWTMGNLGRAGYGATTDGLWPYSYDSCDVGTLPNQTYPGTQTPPAALINGDPAANGSLSYLPGHRLSACTCAGESHPGPVRRDGSYVGRSAPEIDVVEATVISGTGYASLSAQWAPFDAGYIAVLNNQTTTIFNTDRTTMNTYLGGRYQQATSGLGITNQSCYELTGGCFALYGFEYKPGFDNAYITWINEVQAWTIYSTALGPDSTVEINQRLISLEPMYMIANLGISEGFGKVDIENLQFPTTMLVDYIRIYQRSDSINIGCDPTDFPTAQYINTYMEAYTNPNLTTWAQFKQPWPKNKLSEKC
jgi:beta-glucanase (GH16 family)